MRYKLRLALGFFSSLIFGAAMPAMLKGLQVVLDAVFDTSTDSLSTPIILIALSFPLIGIIRGVSHYFSVLSINSVGYQVITDLRNDSFSALQRLSMGFFTKQRAGDIISRVSNDTTIVQQAVSSTLGDLVRAPFMLLGLMGYLVYEHPKLSLITLLVVPTCILPVLVLGKKVKRYSKQNQEKLAGLVSVLDENIGGAKVVRAFGTEDIEQAKFEAESGAIYKRLVKMIRYRALSQPLMEVVTFIGIGAALILVKRLGLTHGEFTSFFGAVIAMYDPIKKLSRSHMTVQNATAAADRIFELIDSPVDIEERADAKPMEGDVEEIVFDDVAFDYGEGALLQGINLTVKRGECIAFVGGSGSGKTTLVGLLPRFYDVIGGSIRINGADIRDVELMSLRDRMGLVSQDTFLFNDTVAANIAYGDTEIDMARVLEAAQQANALAFVEEMPEGFETIVGDKGVRLSGGQRQRLSIARALYRNAPILILDEATSALDTQAERQVQAAIDKLMEGRTVFAIAHRLSTIQHADRIVVLKDGRIIEQGRHEELLLKDGAYRYLYDLQFSDQAEAKA